jgi:aspartyl/asparaginyl-tRNA synthetase
MLFLKLNDGQSSHMLQAVVPRNIIPTVVPGSAIKLLGRWIPSQGQEQDMEFLTEKCIFLGKMEELVSLRPINNKMNMDLYQNYRCLLVTMMPSVKFHIYD